jgi:hypothetical protein
MLISDLVAQAAGDRTRKALLRLSRRALDKRMAEYPEKFVHEIKLKSKKAGRSWHHHSCALRRQSIGAGG